MTVSQRFQGSRTILSGLVLFSVASLSWGNWKGFPVWAESSNWVAQAPSENISGVLARRVTPVPKPPKTQQLSLASGVEIQLLWVEPGIFQMGCGAPEKACQENQKPPHRVRLDGHWMSRRPVTQKQWKSVMGNNPSAIQDPEGPVTNVSWAETQTFLAKVGQSLRLPTESEWERGASKGVVQPAESTGEVQGPETGLQSIFWGQISEWTQDGYQAQVYAKRADTLNVNPVSPASASGHRTVRGGPRETPSVYHREGFSEGSRDPHRGFRVVRDAVPALKRATSSVGDS